MDERELRQQLLNCAVGPLEAVMYDALGSKVDTLSETGLMEELEKLAVVKIVAVVQAVNYPAMISEENPIKQPTGHSSPAHRSPAHSSPTHRSQAHSSPAHKSTVNSSSVHSNLFYIPQWMRPTGFQSPNTNIIEVERDRDSKQADMFKVEKDGPTKKDNIVVTKKAVKRITLAMQAAEEPTAKPDDEKEDCSDKDRSDDQQTL
jgi:hypothetical protein